MRERIIKLADKILTKLENEKILDLEDLELFHKKISLIKELNELLND